MPLDLISRWRSTRRFKPDKIEDHKIKNILEAGRRAPSWQNLQPWRFLVVTEQDDKNELAKIVVTKKLVEKAPVVICIFGDLTGFHVDKSFVQLKDQMNGKMTDDELRDYLKNKTASPSLCPENILYARLLEQISYTAAFMLIEAAHQGLGACIVGGIENKLTVFDNSISPEKIAVNTYFNIPENLDLLTIIAAGVPNEGSELRSRFPMEKIAFYNRF